ncbi:hypothetical protein [Haladaptatus salinisoli]|uniref:hypothetical protein n=1 Tax=Haladaptatus salinisoli TaxID=2884876 RepID=UPI001D09AFFC|nr:hypothetical protein [Haladaptatus salinisoli]
MTEDDVTPGGRLFGVLPLPFGSYFATFFLDELVNLPFVPGPTLTIVGVLQRSLPVSLPTDRGRPSGNAGVALAVVGVGLLVLGTL